MCDDHYPATHVELRQNVYSTGVFLTLLRGRYDSGALGYNNLSLLFI